MFLKPRLKFKVFLLTQKPQARVAELARRAGLKIQWWQHRVGSTPTLGTSSKDKSGIICRFYRRKENLYTSFVIESSI